MTPTVRSRIFSRESRDARNRCARGEPDSPRGQSRKGEARAVGLSGCLSCSLISFVAASEILVAMRDSNLRRAQDARRDRGATGWRVLLCRHLR
jgi:hypothetical protein